MLIYPKEIRMKISKKWRTYKLARNLGKTDVNVQCFVSKDGTIRQAFTHVCFGRTVCEERKQFIRNHNRYHPKNPITTLEVWQADNITNLFGNTTRADQILDIMNGWGLFRNCKVERFNKIERAHV